MNAILQSQLDRVEASLNTLIDSITSYNPSVPAAIDLLSADDELTKGLEQRKSTSLPAPYSTTLPIRYSTALCPRKKPTSSHAPSTPQ